MFALRRSAEAARIFFLTFFADHSIYESHCDFFKIANFDKGESFHGCKKESRCKEEGCSEKEEVVFRALRDAQSINSKTAPATEPFLFCGDMAVASAEAPTPKLTPSRSTG